MWCSVESLFIQTTLPPAATLTGLGVNDEGPVEPRMATVTCDDDGDGDGDTGAGLVGVGALVEVPPHAPDMRDAVATTVMNSGNRMETSATR